MPAAVSAGRAPPAAAAEVPWQHLQGLRSDSDIDEMPHGRGAGSRWIIAVVMLGALALIAGTVGRTYLLGFIQKEQSAPVLDERVPALLEQARLALAKGDLDNANAELAKADVLAAGDPRIAAAMARLELSRAELSWLEQRLHATLAAAQAAAAEKAPVRRKKSEVEVATEAAAAEKQAAEKKQLEQSFKERMARAKAAVAEAVKRAPTALEVVRAQVDALRLEGQVKAARALVGGLAAQASDPDNAFSLGALDLAEGESGYPSAIDRLRVASRAEEALGKARALLIYALAESGDAAAASAELDKLQTLAPNHRALPALRGLVELARSRTPPTLAAAPPQPRAAPPVVRKPAPPPRAPQTSREPLGGDLSDLLSQANTLHRQGELTGAERLYQNALNRSPGNIQALTGLGDVARQRQEVGKAASYYDQILKIDRNHVTTLMSRADLYWHAGNRILAVALYRRVLGQVGQSDPRGQRAMHRIEEFDKEGSAEGTGSAGAPGSEGTSQGSAGATSPSEPGSEPVPDEEEPAGSGDSDETEAPGPSTSPAPASPPRANPPATPAPPPGEEPTDESAEEP
jgi:Flp pilus assembly protein TadD